MNKRNTILPLLVIAGTHNEYMHFVRKHKLRKVKRIIRMEDTRGWLHNQLVILPGAVYTSRLTLRELTYLSTRHEMTLLGEDEPYAVTRLVQE